MASTLLRRTTFVVPDAEAAAKFYIDVFGWKRWYDNVLPVDHRFPPAAPDGAKAHLVLVQVEDPLIGMLGFMSYLDPPFDTAVPTQRTKVRMGEPILVIGTTHEEIDGIHQRAQAAGANIVSPPTNWTVPSNDGKGTIQLRTMSMFDPVGIYSEVNVVTR